MSVSCQADHLPHQLFIAFKILVPGTIKPYKLLRPVSLGLSTPPLLLSTVPRQMSLRSTSGSMGLGQPSRSSDTFQYREFQTSVAQASPAAVPFHVYRQVLPPPSGAHHEALAASGPRALLWLSFLSLLADHLPVCLPASKFLFQAQPFY